MYSLDINFLNDRPEYKTRVIKPPKGAAGKPVDQTPILIGLGVAVGLNALMGGGWFVLTRQNASLSREVDALEVQLGEKNVQVQALDRIYAEAKQTNEEADALALVFNEIKPWSALSQEMAKIMQIAGVRITNLRQTEPTNEATTASEEEGQTPARQTAQVTIEGNVGSFGQLNDFMLLVNQSPFFNGSTTRLVSARLQDNPTRLVVADGSSVPGGLPDLQPIVQFSIETRLSSATASELLPLLKANDALGLVNRIETLTEQGVIRP
ncbi:PilN domain-containing protein [Limnospira fusiformis]|uniref:PilN domain-containing protein n=1 Tax=Limnospira fusiformis TaxID=54297 RepID=UPI00144921F9|nr:fimbrial assembly protein [Limnospira fusiformis SAG 85.79]